MGGLAGALRFARFAALSAFLLGGVRAAVTFLGRDFVLEFQAGSGSSTAEKLQAIVQSAAIEAWGFGALGLALGLLAAGVAALVPGARTPPARGERFAACLLLFVTAFFTFHALGWLAEEILPFLPMGQVLLLDAAAIAGVFVAYAAYAALAARLPMAPRAAPLAITVGVVAVGSLATWLAIELLFGVSGGYRSPARLAAAGGAYLVGLPLAAVLARALRSTCAVLSARLTLGPLLPRPLSLGLWVALLVATAVSAPAFRLSAVPQETEYARLRAAKPAPSERPSVVFVTVDTLRADHLGCYGYGRDTSPFLDGLAAAGARFDEPVSAAAWTKPATGTILTGLYPSRHGALYHGSVLQLPEGERTLAQAFQDAGYVTAGFVSNPNIKAVFDFDAGFDAFFDSPVEDTLTLACIRATWFGHVLMQMLRHQFNWKYENDVRQMNEHVFGWLASQDPAQPFFLYVHYIDPHIPYDPPQPWRGAFEQDHGFPLHNARKERVGMDLYDAEIRYTDEGLRELVDELRARGRWQNTLFVLTSDHGEEFFEHEILGHGFSLFQPVVRVPMILHGPGVPPGTVVEGPAQVLDLPATVLDLAGTGHDRLGDGRSFAAALSGDGWRSPDVFLENEFGQDDGNQRAFVFTGVRRGRYKLVLTEANAYFPPQVPGNDAEALYDLEADPGERTNLIDDPDHRALVEELLAELRRHSTFLSETGFRDVPPAALSPEIEANLRALGY